jgi:Uma2 family endonuclease
MTTVAEHIVPAAPLNGRYPEQRFLLHDVGWPTYVAVGDLLGDRPALRLTYDRGTLEFMTTSPEHEIYKKRMGRLIETLAEEFSLAVATAGNMTFRREDLGRGLEADDCFWIAQEPWMRGKLAWDPAADPPPDLALEIEISRSAVNRMGIYAALGVPEVWRFDGEALRAHLLQPDRTYQPSESSPSFPGMPLAGIVPYLQPSAATDYLGMIRSFRLWVREQLARRQA